ncbi:hypothetical protein CYLTODRAFT_490266 [Cylindrobasidium torrendii FP15055 ss-10]|uniref:Uncharacterized protein n=1 Tax=Cylindrobasidium torrendii FP15055 ss-10 TaxID=1314674 RepID=A0A0D7BBH0_9AGAR|nr:hypothetical protein CYLTODRAFT_490266 [Cylindrobasidium torrendii FP15055 ss-10]
MTSSAGSSPAKSIASPIGSPKRVDHEPSPTLSNISAPFPGFDHQNAIVRPFAAEAERDAAFQKQLSAMLLEATLETHAWAATRPRFETESTLKSLEERITVVIETETEQGTLRPPPSFFHNSNSSTLFEKTRQNINDFVGKVKTALSALASF